MKHKGLKNLSFSSLLSNLDSASDTDPVMGDLSLEVHVVLYVHRKPTQQVQGPGGGQEEPPQTHHRVDP